jgi:hypothetical protein
VPKPKHRFKRKNYVTLEQSLLAISARCELRLACDLWDLLPPVDLPESFDTAELARQIDRPRWFAQKVAYCLRGCSAIESIGKRGNNQLYQLSKPKPKAARSTRTKTPRRPAA